MRVSSLGHVLVIGGLLLVAAGPPLAQRPAPRPAPAPAPGAREILSGQVTAIDASRGTVRLLTSSGEVDLPLPAGGLGDIQVGDWLTVEIELHPSTAPGGRNGTGAAPPEN